VVGVEQRGRGPAGVEVLQDEAPGAATAWRGRVRRGCRGRSRAGCASL
jgi:hypothetical protein